MLDKENMVAVTLPTSLRILMPHGRVDELKLETYLAGVVATEIGASAPLESLKAQAVAARTYAATAHRHPEQNADVCTTAHCQKWKHVDPVVAPEVFRALSETWGMVAVFEGKLIDAFFFEHCDGHTRNSEDMLMPTVKYLRGVDCSCGFLALKGHGVGMCKRGAIVMARRGASFEQILRHYYRGVVVIHTAVENHVAPEAEPAAPIIQAPAPKPTAHRRKAARATPVKLERQKAETRKSPRPAVARPSAHTAPPAPRPIPTAGAAKPVKETIIVEPTPPAAAPVRAASETKTEKLRDVIVGEVVPKSAATLSEPPREIKPPRRVHIDHLPGARMIAGCLPNAGIAILIEDPLGNKSVAQSGSAEHYGEGGFEVIVEEDGRYLVTLDDQVVEVNVTGETIFIHAN
ncbi:MAG TPA: SpoIID/LytB domain-containing protein [Anaerolineae bacterium]